MDEVPGRRFRAGLDRHLDQRGAIARERTLEGETVGEAICRAAHEQGAKVVLLPTMPYGTETNQRAFPLSMNVNPSSLFAVVTDLIESLANHGVRKIVLDALRSLDLGDGQ